MLKKLKSQKLLIYERYKGVKLTTEGRKVAVRIIRKHRLWEYFLVEKLQFEWDEVHEVAEELEHISSKKLIDRLDHFLDYPKTDPHGDPIPDSHGKFNTTPQQSLLDIPLNKPAAVSAITGQSTEMLEMLKHKNIRIGTKIEVRKKFSFDHSVELKIPNKSVVTLSEQVARNIMVTNEE
jgi:DtxR family Mn-dependent transcriptional regulator